MFLPKEINLETFIQRVDDRGYTVYPGKRHLRDLNMFQISTMGQVTEEMCSGFLKALAETLDELTVGEGEIRDHRVRVG